MQNLQSALGVVALIAFAWAISENRRAVSLAARRHRPRRHPRAGGAVPQGAAGHARLRLGQSRHRRHRRGEPRRHRRSCSAISAAAPLPFELKFPGNEFVLAFKALPIVLLMSVLTTLLFYWGILPPIVQGLCLRAQPHHGRRRRGRALDRRQHLRRPCRGAAVHPALSRASCRAANCSW